MTNPVFPTLTRGVDSKFTTEETEDVSLKTKIEGGYVVSRAKHTRTPRKTFTTGYTALPPADKATLEAFYNTVKGGSVIFDWKDPVSLAFFQVRFTEALSFKYTGIGNSRMWDVQIKLEQA